MSQNPLHEDREKADKHFSKALELEPDNAVLLGSYMKFLVESKRYANATKVLDRLWAMGYKEIEYGKHYGECLRGLGHTASPVPSLN